LSRTSTPLKVLMSLCSQVAAMRYTATVGSFSTAKAALKPGMTPE